MKKAKFLTILGVMLALGVTACNGNTAKSSSSVKPASVSTSEKSSTSKSTTSIYVPPEYPDGHKFSADTDVAANAEAGTVAYKKATCDDNDGAVRLIVNQSVVTYASGSSRKSGTPNGYTKLSKDDQSFSFKIDVEKAYTGVLYLLGCMDGWSTDGNRNAGFYREGSPSAKIEVNSVALDAAGQQNKTYRDYFGEDQIDTDLSSPSDHLSKDGYAPFAAVTLKQGVNEVKYTRLQTQNMLIKDFVFVLTEAK
jgi:hypothetical protein